MIEVSAGMDARSHAFGMPINFNAREVVFRSSCF